MRTNSSLPASMGSAKTLVTAGLSLITGGLFLFVLFLSRNPLQQSQDLSSSASVSSGSVIITADQSPTPFNTDSQNTINLKANTSGKAVDGIQLAFDIIATTSQPPEISLNTSRLRVLSQEVTSAGHGYSVKVLLATLDLSQSYVTTAPESILLIKFASPYAGEIKLNFDKERSISTEHSSNPPKDILTHIPEFSFAVTGTPLPSPNGDDFYILTDDISSRYKTHELSGSRNEVDKGKLVVDRTYTLKHEAKIQNILDNVPVPIDPIITVRLQVNDNESATRTFNRSALANTSLPLSVFFELPFKAKSENTFKVTVDSLRLYIESNEDNNVISNTYSVSSSAKSCNEICSSNAECPNNYRCTPVGSEKRCRLNTNIDSSSCNDPFGIGNRTCNQKCADTSECADGFTCWYNQCRNPQNVESSVCAQLSAQAQQAIADSCNDSCTANRDCANNMRCFNGSCRLAANPSSTSCSVVVAAARPTATVVSTPRPTVSPVPTPTPRPTASASAQPTATAVPTVTPTPIATPEPEPEKSVWDTLINRIFGSLNFSNLLSGGLIPLAVIAVGVVLLIIALVVVLKPRPKTTTVAPSQPVTPAPKMELHAKPNPAPPSIPGHGVIPAQRPIGEKDIISTTIKNPEKIEMPGEIKVTPPASTLKMADTGAGTSMVQRLKEKGVTMLPTQSAPTSITPTQTPTDLMPNKSQWPDEPTQ